MAKMKVIAALSFVLCIFKLSISSETDSANCSGPPMTGENEALICCDSIFDMSDLEKCLFNANNVVYKKNGKLSDESTTTCVIECAFDMNRLLQGSNNVNKKFMKKHLNSKYPLDKEHKNRLMNLVTVCQPEALKNSKAFPGIVDDEKQCNSYPMWLVSCVVARLMKNCPANHYQNSTICENYRYYMQNCL